MDRPSANSPTSRARSADGWSVLDLAADLSRRGERFAIATVVWRQAPSSGQVGSRALITATGQLHGWIGGACAEPVVIRQALRVIAELEPKLLLLGTPDQFGATVPDGMVAVAISCQSEGAMQVYIEPVVPTPHLTIVGRSPMANTLAELAQALGWHCDLRDGPEFSATELTAGSIVVIATQGHGDEEALEKAVSVRPAFVGLVASRRRGEAVLGTLSDRGISRDLLDRVRVPVGLDLGPTTHREIAVAILAELVQRRAAGEFLAPGPAPPASATVAEALDPVCGMTVRADQTSYPLEHDGVTYYFCCVGCRNSFARDPHTYVTNDRAIQEA